MLKIRAQKILTFCNKLVGTDRIRGRILAGLTTTKFPRCIGIIYWTWHFSQLQRVPVIKLASQNNQLINPNPRKSVECLFFIGILKNKNCIQASPVDQALMIIWIGNAKSSGPMDFEKTSKPMDIGLLS
jgi:hypothetical protein